MADEAKSVVPPPTDGGKVKMATRRNRAVSSRVVAARFLEVADDEKLTQLQVQKLAYFAHGWHLALFDSPLVSDDLEAWQQGPVYEDLWIPLKNCGKNPLRRGCLVEDTGVLAKEQNEVIEAVYEGYGGYSGFRLSSMTHLKGSPWHDTFEVGKRLRISDKSVRDYFRSLPGGVEQ